MNLQDKILKAVKEALNTAFNFDDIADALLDDIKTEPTKNSAYSVKHKWLYPKLVLLVNDVLNDNEPTLILDEQNALFEACVESGIYYLFANNETFIKFIRKYTSHHTDANLNWIDTSNITNMSWVFSYSKFNGDISQWDVSNVTEMYEMFGHSTFNGDISQWDVSNVINMCYMFSNSKFNGDISTWNVSRVTDMRWMFYDSKFNGDISSWNVSSVVDMSWMFYGSQFNGDISKWDVSSVINNDYMFSVCPIKDKYKPKFKK